MIRYIAKRFTSLLLSLIAASVVIFAIIEIIPGDPAAFILGVNARDDTLLALREQMGLNDPILVRYLNWVAGLLQGDFGTSWTYKTPVADLIADRIWVSLPLAIFALLLSTLIAFPAGIIAAARRGGPADVSIMGATQLGVAIPNFWFAMILVLIFAINLRWFSAGGFPGDTLGEDYIRSARAKGLSHRQTLWRHAVRNAMIPVLTIIGLQFSFLLAGGIIIEQVFFLPGLGRLIFQSISARDLIVVESVVMLLVFVVIIVNFAVDLAYALVDPRLRTKA